MILEKHICIKQKKRRKKLNLFSGVDRRQYIIILDTKVYISRIKLPQSVNLKITKHYKSSDNSTSVKLEKIIITFFFSYYFSNMF